MVVTTNCPITKALAYWLGFFVTTQKKKRIKKVAKKLLTIERKVTKLLSLYRK